MLVLLGWFLGSILGLRQSLSSTLEVAAVLAFFIVGAQYLFLGDPITFWSQILRNYLEIQINASVLSTNQSEEIISGFSGWMAGGVAASWFIASSLSIFLGYWAHALLEEKLFFGEDFRKIRASLLWLIVLPLMLCISFFRYNTSLNADCQVLLCKNKILILWAKKYPKMERDFTTARFN